MSAIAPGEVCDPVAQLRVHARVISVRAGLQIIRYVATRGADRPPAVRVQAMPEDSDHVILLPSTANPDFILEEPGDVIVVKAMRDVRLVAATMSHAWAANAAVLRIERIGGREQATRRQVKPTAKVELIYDR